MRVENLTYTGCPAVYDTTLSSSNGATSPNYGLTDVSSTTYARFTFSTSQDRVWYYAFNVTGISSFANITSTSFIAKVTVANKNTFTISLSNLTTTVGSSTAVTKQTQYTTEEVNGGNWSVNDLGNMRIKLAANRQSSTNYFFGANLTINYSITYYAITTTSSTQTATISSSANETESGNSVTITVNTSSLSNVVIKKNGTDITSQFAGTSGTFTYTYSNVNADTAFSVEAAATQSDKLYKKTSSGWSELTKVYKKVSGSWVEQTDLTNVFESNKIYINK